DAFSAPTQPSILRLCLFFEARNLTCHLPVFQRYNAESHTNLFRFRGDSMLSCRWLPIPIVAFIFCCPALSKAEEPFRFPEASHGKGKLQYINDLPVLTVEGTPEEIG